MDGLERAGCRPSVQTSLSPGSACGYGMGRFLPARSTPFADCMQGVATYPSYSTDWNLMQGMYPHPSLPMERAANSFRASSAYYPVTHSNKDLAPSATYPAHHPSLHRSYESVNNGHGYSSPLCAPTSPSPTSTRLSPDLDKKENRGNSFIFLSLSLLFLLYAFIGSSGLNKI